MNNIEENIEKSTGKTAFLASTRNKILVAVIVVVALIATIWIWKAIEISSLKKDRDEKIQAMQKQSEEQLLQTQMNDLMLLAKPYVWAIRTEMMKGNIDAVNVYNNEMVKEKNFQSIIVTDNKGFIVSSTDKKLEGKDYSTIGKAAYLTINETTVTSSGKLITVASPVMGFNNRVGTLVINYLSK